MNFKQSWKKLAHGYKDRIYTLNGSKRKMKVLGNTNKGMEVWYETESSKKLIEEMPFASFLHQIFQGYAIQNSMNVRFFFIIDEYEINDSWYYPDDQVWVVTLKGAIDTMSETLSNLGKEVDLLENYYEEKKLGKDVTS